MKDCSLWLAGEPMAVEAGATSQLRRSLSEQASTLSEPVTGIHLQTDTALPKRRFLKHPSASTAWRAVCCIWIISRRSTCRCVGTGIKQR
jgi:hypothetical protein